MDQIYGTSRMKKSLISPRPFGKNLVQTDRFIQYDKKKSVGSKNIVGLDQILSPIAQMN